MQKKSLNQLTKMILKTSTNFLSINPKILFFIKSDYKKTASIYLANAPLSKRFPGSVSNCF